MKRVRNGRLGPLTELKYRPFGEHYITGFPDGPLTDKTGTELLEGRVRVLASPRVRVTRNAAVDW